jgi:hypothetical protein
MKTSRISTTAKVAILAIASSVVGALSASAQLVTFTPGDLVIGFQASSGTGSETNFFYNFGSTVALRDGTAPAGNSANIGSFLSATYGANWFSRTDLSWGAVGVRNNVSPFPPFGAAPAVVDGDPSATVYVSRGALSPGSSTPWTGYATNGLVAGATSMRGLLDQGSTAVTGSFAKQTALADSNGFGAYVLASATQSWTTKMAGNAADFGLFTSSIEGNFGTGGSAAYIDIYRMLARTNQADTVILDGNTTIGTGSLITTLSIDSAGNLSASVIPEPSAFAALAGIGALGVAALRRRRRVA